MIKKIATVILILTWLSSTALAIECSLVFDSKASSTPFIKRAIEAVRSSFFGPLRAASDHSEFKVKNQSLLDANLIMSEGKRETLRLRNLPADQRSHKHVEYYKSLVPELLRMLERIPANVWSRRYFLTDLNGNILENLSTVGQVRAHLVRSGHEVLRRNHVDMAFITEFVMEILTLHFYIWKNLHQFEFIKATAKYKIDLLDLKTEGASPDTAESAHRFLNYHVFSKRWIKILIKDGVTFWPVFASLKSKNFNDWHYGLKPIGISLSKKIPFDGNKHDFMYLAEHDLVVHNATQEIIEYADEFSSFKEKVFQKLGLQSKLTKEIIRIMWFLGTHEFNAILDHYLIHKVGLSLDLHRKTAFPQTLEMIVESHTFTNRLLDPEYFLNEMSPAIQTMPIDLLDQEVQKAFSIFTQAYFETLAEEKSSLSQSEKVDAKGDHKQNK